MTFLFSRTDTNETASAELEHKHEAEQMLHDVNDTITEEEEGEESKGSSLQSANQKSPDQQTSTQTEFKKPEVNTVYVD